jgi:hypothetical protein
MSEGGFNFPFPGAVSTGGSADVSAVCANDGPLKQMPSAMQLVAQSRLTLRMPVLLLFDSGNSFSGNTWKHPRTKDF